MFPIQALKKIKQFIVDQISKIAFAALLAIFVAYIVFIALHVDRAIVPDEVYHYLFSQHYAATWGIPKDTPETWSYGWFIKQNPFLYYWLNGRALNFIRFVVPSVSDWQQLVFLRLLSTIYVLGTVIFCYLLSKEVIKNKWWQLLPPFLLTNTLMFVFLSGGVNYDNLANLFCMAGLYFLARVFTRKNFILNSLAWMISISLGTLTKYPVVPLALAMGVAWVIFIFVNRKTIFPLQFKGVKLISLGVILLGLFSANTAIYGVNLVRYQSLTPGCTDILTQEQCSETYFVKRYNEIGLDHKLSIVESIQAGYPNPLEYVVDQWIPTMLYRIYGIAAHRFYMPSHIIILFRLLLLWVILLAFRYIRKPSFAIYSLAGIFIFYALVLLYMNYNSELLYGFQHIAFQGRYLFPVIGAAYVLVAYLLTKVENKFLQYGTLAATAAIFFAGGPIKFILHYNTIFQGWFV